MRTPEETTRLLRSHGLKVTPQRHAVVAALQGDDRHPTAEVIWARVCETMPTASLRTVYQALNDLVELGELQTVSVGKGAVRFDPNVSEHSHFVCHVCGRVYDVMSSVPELAASSHEVAGPGHLVDTAEVIFRGRCASCFDSDSTESIVSI